MLQAVVFDFDGVLANSEPLHLRAFQSVLSARGLALSAQEYYEAYVGFDDETVFRELAHDRGLRVTDGWVAGLTSEKMDALQRLLQGASPLFPGAAAAVRAMAARVPVAVASGAVRREIVQMLDGEELTGVFTAIVAAGETERGKPAPDPYRRAVELMEVASGAVLDPAHVVAVEDSLQGLASARAAGLQTIALSTTFRPEALTGAALVLPDISAVTFERLNALWTRVSDA
jgi:HAD superfamily hydrolase (TIGR01509 family)